MRAEYTNSNFEGDIMEFFMLAMEEPNGTEVEAILFNILNRVRKDLSLSLSPSDISVNSLDTWIKDHSDILEKVANMRKEISDILIPTNTPEINIGIDSFFDLIAIKRGVSTQGIRKMILEKVFSPSLLHRAPPTKEPKNPEEQKELASAPLLCEGAKRDESYYRNPEYVKADLEAFAKSNSKLPPKGLALTSKNIVTCSNGEKIKFKKYIHNAAVALGFVKTNKEASNIAGAIKNELLIITGFAQGPKRRPLNYTSPIIEVEGGGTTLPPSRLRITISPPFPEVIMKGEDDFPEQGTDDDKEGRLSKLAFSTVKDSIGKVDHKDNIPVLLMKYFPQTIEDVIDILYLLDDFPSNESYNRDSKLLDSDKRDLDDSMLHDILIKYQKEFGNIDDKIDKKSVKRATKTLLKKYKKSKIQYYFLRKLFYSKNIEKRDNIIVQNIPLSSSEVKKFVVACGLKESSGSDHTHYEGRGTKTYEVSSNQTIWLKNVVKQLINEQGITPEEIEHACKKCNYNFDWK